MATADNGVLLDALRGQTFRKDVISGLLDRFDLSAMFGHISREEILSLLFA